MKIAMIVSASIVVGFLLSSFLYRSAITKLNKRIRSVRSGGESKVKKKMETTKKVVWVCLANGFAWVWCSYVLAYLDKMQIAESLSQVAVTEIIGVVLAYCIKSAVENLSKNNSWPDKPTPYTTEDLEQQKKEEQHG
ncbi:MAG: hypothetical protein RR365_02300 [Bacteroides sp.]